jgi:hypothetical protein
MAAINSSALITDRLDQQQRIASQPARERETYAVFVSLRLFDCVLCSVWPRLRAAAAAGMLRAIERHRVSVLSKAASERE